MIKKKDFLTIAAVAVSSFAVLAVQPLQAISVQNPSAHNPSYFNIANPLSGSNPTFSQGYHALPQIGSRTTEPSFGLGLTRLTNAGNTGARHEYSRFDPYNSNQSYILLNGKGGRSNVYSTKTYPYNGVGNLVTSLSLKEARWDRNKSNLIWGLGKHSIQTVNVSSGKTSLIKDFSKDPRLQGFISSSDKITMRDEGESSYDKRYWAFLVKGGQKDNYRSKHIFTWDRKTDQILGVYTLKGNERKIDWVGMSPKGNYVLIGGGNYKGDETKENVTGLTMANKDFSRFNRLDYTTAHADVGLDSQGNEVVVMQNTRTDYVDMIPIDWKTKAIKKASDGYEGTNRTKLIRLYYRNSSPEGFKGGVHISGNHDGYVLISTTLGPDKKEQNWLDKSLVLVKLDPNDPEARYLSKTYNTTDHYWEETHGTITNDGKRVIWASNWDQGVGEKKNFLLELDLVGDGVSLGEGGCIFDQSICDNLRAMIAGQGSNPIQLPQVGEGALPDNAENIPGVPLPGGLVLFASALFGLFGLTRQEKNKFKQDV